MIFLKINQDNYFIFMFQHNLFEKLILERKTYFPKIIGISLMLPTYFNI